MMMRHLNLNKQSGLTLIEVLVALLVLAVGLLGMASLQVRAVQDTTNASFRSIAIYYASDMADRMRANPDGLDAGLYDDEAGGAETENCLKVTGCSSADMARHDKWEWGQNLQTVLPGGRGELSNDAGVYTVEVFWSDRVQQFDADNDVDVGIEETSVTFVFEP